MPFPDPRGLSNAKLVDHIRELDREIVRLEQRIPTRAEERATTRRLMRGAVLTIGGLLLSPPLGAATLLLTAAGLWDWVDGAVQDNRMMNRALAAKLQIAALTAELKAAETELHRRRRSP